MTHTHYNKVIRAIDFLQKNIVVTPDLKTLATAINISVSQLQKTFNEWAGVSPEEFMLYIHTRHTKSKLQKPQQTLFSATEPTDLNNIDKLQIVPLIVEGMTPHDCFNKGQNLTIYYQHYPTRFGPILIGNTNKGVCSVSFTEVEEDALLSLKNDFSKANCIKQTHPLQTRVVEIFDSLTQTNTPLKLHIKGTPFQLKVWKTLLKIPLGELSTYGTIAKQIHQPTAARAVGTAIGKNPIAFLIPCHRVINTTGVIGNYMWGSTRKKAIIGWEAAKVKS
ncbi:methylated-DNA--[protein]-cysteine S-methyltransferase [Wenyingzhuangia sp. IMCC45533]